MIEWLDLGEFCDGTFAQACTHKQRAWPACHLLALALDGYFFYSTYPPAPEDRRLPTMQVAEATSYPPNTIIYPHLDVTLSRSGSKHEVIEHTGECHISQIFYTYLRPLAVREVPITLCRYGANLAPIEIVRFEDHNIGDYKSDENLARITPEFLFFGTLRHRCWLNPPNSFSPLWYRMERGFLELITAPGLRGYIPRSLLVLRWQTLGEESVRMIHWKSNNTQVILL